MSSTSEPGGCGYYVLAEPTVTGISLPLPINFHVFIENLHIPTGTGTRGYKKVVEKIASAVKPRQS